MENTDPKTQPQQQVIIVNQETQRKGNGLGVAGLVLTCIGLVGSWIPILGWVIWFLGFLFSLIGVFKKPRTCAIIGLILSIIDLLVLILIIGALGVALAGISAL